MKYVELVGLPGAGKTTLVQDAACWFQRRKQPVYTRVNIKHESMRKMLAVRRGSVWRLLSWLANFPESTLLKNLVWDKHQVVMLTSFFSQYPQVSSQLIAGVSKVDPPDWMEKKWLSREKLNWWFLDLAGMYQSATEYLDTDDVFFQEEGFCQQAYYWMAFQRGGFCEERLFAYLACIPRPDLFVAVLSDPKQCERRMQQRRKGVASDLLKTMTVEQRQKLLEQRLGVYKLIADYLESEHVPVLRLSNEDYQEALQEFQEALGVRFV